MIIASLVLSSLSFLGMLVCIHRVGASAEAAQASAIAAANAMGEAAKAAMRAEKVVSGSRARSDNRVTAIEAKAERMAQAALEGPRG